MAPAILTSVINSARITLGARVPKDIDISSLGPLAANSALLGRNVVSKRDDDGDQPVHRVGIDPHDINNNAIFALFGLIGVAFVIGGIWFFFWAKNGGFYFREDDWDDYKSTVLRRKGPNGTILSNATKSTKLGGGSVYKDIDDGSTEATPTVITDFTDSTAMSGITAGASDIGAREKRRKKKEQREREKERRREEKAREKEEYRRRKASKRKVGEDGLLIDEDAEKEAKEHLRHYRHEKPARVGGLNKESEASEWDGSTNPTLSTMSESNAGYPAAPESVYTYNEMGSTVTSELMGNQERTPTSTPTKTGKGGIRKVYSTADKTANRESERDREEARRLREKGRSAGPSARHSRRDFSWKPADDGSTVSSTTPLRAIEEVSAVSDRTERSDRSERSERERTERRARHARSKSRGARARDEDGESHVPGSWAQSDVGSESDLGTKVYRHSVHIPIPSSAASSTTASTDFAYADEKRKRRGGAGYRRDRNRDDLN